MLAGVRPTIFGTASRDAILPMWTMWSPPTCSHAQPRRRSVAGKVFNIACGARHTLLDVYETLAKIIGFEGPPLYGPPRTGDILNSQADISAAAEAIRYQAAGCFEAGLKRTIDWYRESSRRRCLRPGAALRR